MVAESRHRDASANRGYAKDAQKNMNRIRTFRMPAAVTITGRSSTMTAAFVSAIIPIIEPTDSELQEALEILGMDSNDVRCAYCGESMTEWDHLRPLVSGQKPTGYISEIGNLVPSCGKCNQSKGNKPWREWMLGGAKRSPKSRAVSDLDNRIERLEAYERWRPRPPLDLEGIVEAGLWSRHWENWRALLQLMNDSQQIAKAIRSAIKARMR